MGFTFIQMDFNLDPLPFQEGGQPNIRPKEFQKDVQKGQPCALNNSWKKNCLSCTVSVKKSRNLFIYTIMIIPTKL